MVSLVVHHRLGDELIAHATEARQRGFHHQRLVNSETGFHRAKAIARMRDGEEAVAREAVRCGEAGANTAFVIRTQRGIPKCDCEKLAAQLASFATAADDMTFVSERNAAGIFRTHKGKRSRSVDAKRARRIKKRMQIGRFIAGEIENALVHGVQRDLGAGHRRAGVVVYAQQNLHFLAGLIIGLGQFRPNIQARTGALHF